MSISIIYSTSTCLDCGRDISKIKEANFCPNCGFDLEFPLIKEDPVIQHDLKLNEYYENLKVINVL